MQTSGKKRASTTSSSRKMSYSAKSKEQDAHDLRRIFDEAEKKQLSAWLDKKNKELEAQLAKLGVGVNASSTTLLPNEDVLRIMGQRFHNSKEKEEQQLSSPIHFHHMGHTEGEQSDDDHHHTR